MDSIETLIQLAPTFITIGLGIVAGAGGYYVLAKGKIHQLNIKLKQASVFVDSIDRALYDDAVKEEEFREAWEAGKTLVTK